MKTKFSPSELYVVCNILDKPSFAFEVYTSASDACDNAYKQSLLHNDESTCYEVLPLDCYLTALSCRISLIDMFNQYHRD